MSDSAALDGKAVSVGRVDHRRRLAVQRVSEVMERGLARLPAQDVEDLAVRLEQIVASPLPRSPRNADLIRSLAGRDYSDEERVQLEQLALLDHFRRRRELLMGSLTTAQVADILGTSRQTPHDRVKSGSLLAVMDHGTLRFPAWQFDAESESGVVTGLPEVVRSLRASPLARIRWMTKSNPFLDGETPLGALKSGQVERVLDLARGVART